jgi:hypothetical protein
MRARTGSECRWLRGILGLTSSQRPMTPGTEQGPILGPLCHESVPRTRVAQTVHAGAREHATMTPWRGYSLAAMLPDIFAVAKAARSTTSPSSSVTTPARR